MEFADPDHWAIAEGNEISGVTADAVWVMWRLIVPEAAEVGVGIAVKSEVRSRL